MSIGKLRSGNTTPNILGAAAARSAVRCSLRRTEFWRLTEEEGDDASHRPVARSHQRGLGGSRSRGGSRSPSPTTARSSGKLPDRPGRRVPRWARRGSPLRALLVVSF
ncbi:hypothetical protein NL676_005538 [Syzygium grande]|nr:hypothetical protein NL676_005538 [Syzygium grande]